MTLKTNCRLTAVSVSSSKFTSVVAIINDSLSSQSVLIVMSESKFSLIICGLQWYMGWCQSIQMLLLITFIFCPLVVTWLVPRETAAISVHILCMQYNTIVAG